MANILTLLQNKWVVRFILAVIIIIAALSIRNYIYTTGYDDGIAYQKQVQVNAQAKAKQEFDVVQKKADDERATLNAQIASLNKANTELRDSLAKKNQKTNQEATDYAKTTTGSMSCFAPDDNGLRIINDSFPGTKALNR